MPFTKVPGSTIASDVYCLVHDVSRGHRLLPAKGIGTCVCIGNGYGVACSLPLDDFNIEVILILRANPFWLQGDLCDENSDIGL